MVREIILSISRLADPRGSGDRTNLVLEILLDDPLLQARPDVQAQLEAEVEEVRGEAEPIRQHRHKSIAHLDLAVAMGSAELLVEFTRLCRTVLVPRSIQEEEVSLGATARVKSNLSAKHLAAAKYFAGECATLEARDAHLDWQQPAWHPVQHYSTGAIILAVAALEASVNELFLRAQDRNKDALPGLTESQMALLEQLWATVDRAPVLDKYQVVLTACEKAPLDKGAKPFQSAAGLVDLRNALVHFKPEWDDELRTHARLESKLTGKFPENQLAMRATGSMVWFPSKCLGAGAAKWACETAVALSRLFTDHLGITGAPGAGLT